MEKIWHKYPEAKPEKSGDYIVILNNGGIYRTPYSKMHDAFNATDWYSSEEAEILRFGGVAYWCEISAIAPNELNTF